MASTGPTEAALLASAHTLDDRLDVLEREYSWVSKVLLVPVYLSFVVISTAITVYLAPPSSFIAEKLSQFLEYFVFAAILAISIILGNGLQYIRFDIDRYALRLSRKRLLRAMEVVEKEEN